MRDMPNRLKNPRVRPEIRHRFLTRLGLALRGSACSLRCASILSSKEAPGFRITSFKLARWWACRFTTSFRFSFLMMQLFLAIGPSFPQGVTLSPYVFACLSSCNSAKRVRIYVGVNRILQRISMQFRHCSYERGMTTSLMFDSPPRNALKLDATRNDNSRQADAKFSAGTTGRVPLSHSSRVDRRYSIPNCSTMLTS